MKGHEAMKATEDIRRGSVVLSGPDRARHFFEDAFNDGIEDRKRSDLKFV